MGSITYEVALYLDKLNGPLSNELSSFDNPRFLNAKSRKDLAIPDGVSIQDNDTDNNTLLQLQVGCVWNWSIPQAQSYYTNYGTVACFL